MDAVPGEDRAETDPSEANEAAFLFPASHERDAATLPGVVGVDAQRLRGH